MPRIFRSERLQTPATNTDGGQTVGPQAPAEQPPASAPGAPDPNVTAQYPAATPTNAPQEPGAAGNPQIAGLDLPSEPESAGFGERGRMRRRIHFLRKARELAYRDLGGLVFDLHRFGRRHDELVAAKLGTLERIDTELRSLQSILGKRQSITVLREAGVAACPRCAAIHGSDDRFCPGCGIPMGRRADRPIAVASGGPPMAPVPAAPVAQPPAPAPLPGQTAMELQGPGSSVAPPVPAAAPASPQPADPQPVAAPQANLERPSSSPSRESEDQPTRIVDPPSDLVPGSTRERPGENQSSL